MNELVFDNFVNYLSMDVLLLIMKSNDNPSDIAVDILSLSVGCYPQTSAVIAERRLLSH